jgi:hypothetical protein
VKTSYLIDTDGVIYQGSQPIPAAADYVMSFGQAHSAATSTGWVPSVDIVESRHWGSVVPQSGFGIGQP